MLKGQRSPAMANVRGFLGPCILAFLGLLIQSKIQNNISNLPKVSGDIDNYCFSYFKSVITAEDDAFVQLVNRTNTKMAAGKMKRRLILWSLLLLCGDIMQNPGPSSPPTTKGRLRYKFPCGICEKPVKSNQKGIQCDFCDLWYHARCLDLIFTNTPGLVNNCHSPDKFSDHCAVACTLNTSIPFKQKPRRKVYLFSKGDYDSLQRELQQFQESLFQSTSEDTDIGGDWEIFKSALKGGLNLNLNEI